MKSINLEYQFDICVIGGGMSGICAAVSAARKGAKVALVHDRAVLGGNASEEVKMWIRGASSNFPFYRESGLIEEIALRNAYFNPTMSYGVWSGVLYDLVTAEKNLTLFLNTACLDAKEDNQEIKSVTCWRLTSYEYIKINAEFFIDCSGDSVLSFFTSAKYMVGREDKGAFNEPHGQHRADEKTMGSSCILQARKTNKAIPFTAPSFAKKFNDDNFLKRLNIDDRTAFSSDNYWWIELGGDMDVIKDAATINHELIACAYGVWDYVKNSGKFDSQNWQLEWVGFLGGKRESRRYLGDYVLSEGDIVSSVKFFDEVAYGGWYMDDHNPLGLKTNDAPNRYVYFDKPYSIPYRCLYSSNLKNLFFAGRNVSVTHMALSSTRVMATCALIGQAAGTAAFLAFKKGVDCRGVLDYIDELKQILRRDDCFLLHTPRIVSMEISKCEKHLKNPLYKKILRGVERKTERGDVAIILDKGERFEIEFEKIFVENVRLLLDSDVAREFEKDYELRQFPQILHITDEKLSKMPPNLVKNYSVFVKKNGEWKTALSDQNNFKRLIFISIGEEIEGVAFMASQTYGAEKVKLLSLDVEY